ncbi:hypothetical protein [Thermotalea metallivorans]|uniref:Uncharacterized protein n=1 Tax=Thermotalea metallivorans TaxID=520762 RepID=A0A140L3H7_9FIRM|nr:hypothetical protein [Thermotalea metallivorans]KXG75102.1 hypothetical protein AN619_19280 [Thermotalea metallivorans]
MKENSLVREILAGISDRMTIEENKGVDRGSSRSGKGRRVFVIFVGYSQDIEQTFYTLRQLKRYGYQLMIALSKEVERKLGKEKFQRALYPQVIFTEEEKDRCLEQAASMDILLVLNLNQLTVAKLRAGLQDTMETCFIWQALWEGKPVLAREKDVTLFQGKPSKNDRLLRIAEENLVFLKEAGIRMVEDPCSLKAITEAGIYENFDVGEKGEQELHFSGDLKKRQVITEKDILAMVGKTNRIYLSPNSVVTPLALDTAKQKNIALIRP